MYFLHKSYLYIIMISSTDGKLFFWTHCNTLQSLWMWDCSSEPIVAHYSLYRCGIVFFWTYCSTLCSLWLNFIILIPSIVSDCWELLSTWFCHRENMPVNTEPSWPLKGVPTNFTNLSLPSVFFAFGGVVKKWSQTEGSIYCLVCDINIFNIYSFYFHRNHWIIFC